MSSWGSNDFFGVQGIFTIPTWPFWAIVVVGSILAAVAYLLAAGEHVGLSLRRAQTVP
jgi:hypothetical protein